MIVTPQRSQNIEGYPVGTRVVTPSGRYGTVVKHRAKGSKIDPYERLVIQFDGGDPEDQVILQPKYVRAAD